MHGDEIMYLRLKGVIGWWWNKVNLVSMPYTSRQQSSFFPQEVRLFNTFSAFNCEKLFWFYDLISHETAHTHSLKFSAYIAYVLEHAAEELWLNNMLAKITIWILKTAWSENKWEGIQIRAGVFDTYCLVSFLSVLKKYWGSIPAVSTDLVHTGAECVHSVFTVNEHLQNILLQQCQGRSQVFLTTQRDSLGCGIFTSVLVCILHVSPCFTTLFLRQYPLHQLFHTRGAEILTYFYARPPSQP